MGGITLPSKYGTKWSEEETILAFYYYCQIPFGKIDKRNPEIIRIAKLIGRTPDSVTLKMCNLAHFDPAQQQRNVSGMSNASKLDEATVAKFLSDWEEMTYQAKMIEHKLVIEPFAQNYASKEHDLPPGDERTQEVRQRINQDFFRDAVLASYHQQCCITGLNVPSLLIASHIKPWKDSNPLTERTNPSNGLCLNALHDKAFDKGLITVLPDFSIRVSSKVLPGNEGAEWLRQCDHQKIILPQRFVPKKEYLEYHNDVVFVA